MKASANASPATEAMSCRMSVRRPTTERAKPKQLGRGTLAADDGMLSSSSISSEPNLKLLDEVRVEGARRRCCRFFDASGASKASSASSRMTTMLAHTE